MVRKYKRRTEKLKFTAADLQDAARKVNEDKRSICSVAKEAGICHVTLNRYIKKHRDSIPSSIPSYNTESKQVFSEAQESELESYIKKAADIYFGLSRKDVRVLAFQCAKKFNIKMPSTWEEKECAGSDWLNGFLKRQKKFKNHFIRDGLNGCVGAATSSGWMEPETFLLFMKHFVKTFKVNIEHPFLLLLDNHYSHLAIDVLDYCKDNGVVLLSFPPHCSHKLQPLDRTVFGPL